MKASKWTECLHSSLKKFKEVEKKEKTLQEEWINEEVENLKILKKK